MISSDSSGDVSPEDFNIKVGNSWTYDDRMEQSDPSGTSWLNTTTTIDVVATGRTSIEGNMTDVYHVITSRSGFLEGDSSILQGTNATLVATRFDVRLLSNYSLVSSEEVTYVTIGALSLETGYFTSLSPAFDDFVGNDLLSLGWNTTANTSAYYTGWLNPSISGGNSSSTMTTDMTMTMDVVADDVTVTTPAGTFNCFEINATITPNLLYSGLPMVMAQIPYMTMKLYYSYDVGNYVMTSYSYSDSDTTIFRNQTLTSFLHSTDNTPPVANAGPDRTVVTGTNVELNGTMTTDEGTAMDKLNFTWNFTYDGSMFQEYGVVPDFVFFIPGVYNVTLNVTDQGLNYDIDWVTITVIPDTSKPVADAGPDKLVAGGGWVVLDGSSSHDATNSFDELAFKWTFEYDSTDEVLENPIAMFLFEETGNYEITLLVTDPVGNSGTDVLWVNVTPVDNILPVADAGPDQNVPVNTNVIFDGSGSHDNVMIANWTWAFNYEGSNVTLYGPHPEFEFNKRGTYEVILMIRDASNNMGADTMTVTVGGGGAKISNAALISISIAALAAVLIASFFVFSYMKKRK